MTNINSVVVVGRLTRDVDVSYLPSGTAIGKLSIACNRSIKKNDQWEDTAYFFDVSVYGKTAEVLKPYLVKGKQIIVQGFLKQEKWEKDGQKFSKVVIIAENIQLSGGKDSSSGESITGEGVNKIAPNRPQSGFSGSLDEDIPFDNF